MAAFFVRTRFPSPSIPAFCAPAARSPCICSRPRVALRFAQAPAGLTLPFGAWARAGKRAGKPCFAGHPNPPRRLARRAARWRQAASHARAREAFVNSSVRRRRGAFGFHSWNAALRTAPKGFLAAGGDGCIIIDKRIMHRNRPSNEAQTASLKGRVALLSGFLRKRFLPFQQRAPAGKLNGKREILHAPKAGERCGVTPTRCSPAASW